jgi:hypothetical protein
MGGGGPVLGDWLAWLERSGLATALRESTWLYPAVETAHILGFVVLVGAAAMWDLRLLGLSRSVSVSGLGRHLLPWARAGLLVAAPTGLLLFMTDATETAANPAFRLKLVLIAAAGLNAAAFHRWTFGSVQSWDQGVGSPLPARLAGALSLALWTSVITCGRLIAYV